jgi:hypothetical protein
MKNIVLKIVMAVIVSFTTIALKAQMAVNTDGSAPHTSAMLDVKSTTKGFLLPRMTTVQRNTLGGIATAGLMVYDTDLGKLYFHNGSGWNESGVGNYWTKVSGFVILSNITDFVGIGTTTPNRPLEVRSSNWQVARLSTDLSGPCLEFVGTATTDWALTSWVNELQLESSDNDFISRSTQYRFGTSYFTPYTTNTHTLGASSYRWSKLYSTDGDFSGTVGIGTVSPARALEVMKSGNYKVARFSSNMGGALIEFVGTHATDWGCGTWDGSFRISSSTDNFSTISDEYSFTSTYFFPWTTATKYLGASSNRWNTLYSVNGDFSGEVGIGTSSPSSPLHVTSNQSGYASSVVYVENTYTGTNPWIYAINGRVNSSSANNEPGIGVLGISINSTGGGVGVFGQSNGASGFGVKAVANSSSGTNYALYAGTNSNDGYAGYFYGGKSYFQGSVGIGTLSPLGKLHVHDGGSTNAEVYITPAATGSGDNSTLFFAEDHDATYGMKWMYNGAINYMELWGKNNTTDYGPHILVKRDEGDVAIGNTFAAGYKLSVSGKIICTEVRVNLVPDWPDYVFKKGYPLLPVEKLGSYIEENGHLPNIPPASDIQKSGLDVGEMQRLMMEKIEELSLYIVEQQKQIQELKDQLNEQKNK